MTDIVETMRNLLLNDLASNAKGYPDGWVKRVVEEIANHE